MPVPRRTDLAQQLLGIDGEAIELLETRNQRIEDRRADLVARMRACDGSEFLLHAEIANNNDRPMPWRMLEILSENRDLRSKVKEAEKMLTQVDVKRLPSYEIGFEDGVADGEARGEARGAETARRAIVRKLLTRLPAEEAADLLGLSLDEVRRLSELP